MGIARTIHDRARQLSLPLNSGAGPAELDQLATDFARIFGFEQPLVHRELLGLTNGLRLEGLDIFATHTRRDDADAILGLVEADALLRAGSDTTLRFIGAGDADLLAYDTGDGLWKYVMRGHWDDVDEEDTFDTLAGLLATVHEEHLD